jgi:hypothetical protein
MSCQQLQPNDGRLYFHSPGNLALARDPAKGKTLRAFPLPATTREPFGAFDPADPNRWSASLLLHDVISFQVQILTDQPPAAGQVDPFTDVPDVPGQGKVFDTGNDPAPAYGIVALQIALRVWDLKSQQARQVTLVQDM